MYLLHERALAIQGQPLSCPVGCTVKKETKQQQQQLEQCIDAMRRLRLQAAEYSDSCLSSDSLSHVSDSSSVSEYCIISNISNSIKSRSSEDLTQLEVHRQSCLKINSNTKAGENFQTCGILLRRVNTNAGDDGQTPSRLKRRLCLHLDSNEDIPERAYDFNKATSEQRKEIIKRMRLKQTKKTLNKRVRDANKRFNFNYAEYLRE